LRFLAETQYYSFASLAATQTQIWEVICLKQAETRLLFKPL
jgi:hypothetical protein